MFVCVHVLILLYSSKPAEVARSILSGDHNKSQQLQPVKEICEELTKRKTLEATNTTLSSSTSASTTVTSTTDIPAVGATSNNLKMGIMNNVATGVTTAAVTDNNKNDNNDNVNNILRKAIAKLQRKMQEPTKKKFYLHTRLETHILPLTNVAFDRSGEHCLTGSYDRTCRIINTHQGTEEHVLGDHDNVVFSVAYNFPKW